MVVRQLTDLNTTVMDTLSWNYDEKICQNFSVTSDIPYEFAFDVIIDRNIYSAYINVTFNDEILYYRKILDRFTRRL
jgi:hypothetical protein